MPITPAAPATSTLTWHHLFRLGRPGRLIAIQASLPNHDSVMLSGHRPARRRGGRRQRATWAAVLTESVLERAGRVTAVVLTLIVFGAVFGRWWRAALPASAVAWPALLLATGTMSLEPAL